MGPSHRIVRKRRTRKQNTPAEPSPLTSKQIVRGLERVIASMSPFRYEEFVASLSRAHEVSDARSQPKPRAGGRRKPL
jgi:hypothetical protein